MSSILTSGAGANAATTLFGAVAENLANQKTNSFKALSGSTMSVVTSDGGSYSPGGIQTKIDRNVNSQGIFRSTGVSTNLAVASRNGSFLVKPDSGVGAIYVTRDGQFTQNSEGYLGRDGFTLLGWPLETSGKIKEGINIEVTDDLHPVQINSVSGVVRETSNVEFSGNISSNEEELSIGATFNKTQRIFDSLGRPHNLVFHFKRIAASSPPDNAIQYEVTADVSGGLVRRNSLSGTELGIDNRTDTPADSSTPMVVSFNQNGVFNLFDYGVSDSTSPPTIYIEWGADFQQAKNMNITWDVGEGKGVGSALPLPNSVSKISAYSGRSEINFSRQNGLKFGRFESIAVSEKGIVSALFDTGQSIPLYQLAMGIVPNANGLEFKTGNIYSETRQSGALVLGKAGENGVGEVKSGVVEASNANLNDSFSEMVTLKSAHSGNLSALKTSVEMSDALIRLML